MSYIKLTFAALGVLALATIGALVVKIIAAPVAIVEKTLNADNVIYNYEWFKRQYQEIRAFDQKISLAKQSYDMAVESATDNFESRQEVNRLRSVMLGLQTQRRDMIAEYNARTQMANRNLFRTGDLPEYIQE